MFFFPNIALCAGLRHQQKAGCALLAVTGFLLSGRDPVYAAAGRWDMKVIAFPVFPLPAVKAGRSGVFSSGMTISWLT